MTNAKEILEQQKAICWQNKIRKADALLNSCHKNLIVSLKLRPLWKAAVIGAKGCVATYAISELEAEDGSWTEHRIWQLEGRASSFPALMSVLPSLWPNPVVLCSSENQTSLFQTTLTLQNKLNGWKLILLLPLFLYVTRLVSQFLYLPRPLFLRSELLRCRFPFTIDSQKQCVCYSAWGIRSLRVKAPFCRIKCHAINLPAYCIRHHLFDCC